MPTDGYQTFKAENFINNSIAAPNDGYHIPTITYNNYDFWKKYAGLASKATMKVIESLDANLITVDDDKSSLRIVIRKAFRGHYDDKDMSTMCDEITMVAEEVLNSE